jgi:hypothetical protein
MIRFITCAAVLLALATTHAYADSIMTMKGGEWVTTFLLDDNKTPGRTIKICYPADRTLTEADLNRMPPHSTCHNTVQRSGQTFNVQAICTTDKMRTTTNAVVTVVSSEEISMTSQTHIENGPPQMPPDMSMAMHWQHTGPCQPGDRTAPTPPK